MEEDKGKEAPTEETSDDEKKVGTDEEGTDAVSPEESPVAKEDEVSSENSKDAEKVEEVAEAEEAKEKEESTTKSEIADKDEELNEEEEPSKAETNDEVDSAEQDKENGSTSNENASPSKSKVEPIKVNTSENQKKTLNIDDLSPREKNKSFQELRSYEAKRREVYTTKLKSSCLYWRSFRELLAFSLHETERAEDVVRGGLVAAEGYEKYCRAVAEDRIDYDGIPVMDEKKAAKMQEEKMKKYSRLGGGVNNFVKLQDKVSSGASISANDTIYGDSFNFSSMSMVSSLIESQSAIAERFKENISFVEDIALKKIILLRQEVEGEIYIISMLGDALVEELEKAEADVQEAWAAYNNMIRKTQGSAGSSSLDGNEDGGPTKIISDVWIVEMHYRMAVAYLTTMWDKSSTELSRLLQTMKEVECSRRFRLREVLCLYVQRMERLWNSIPSLVSPVLKDLQGRPMDAPAIEKEVQTVIRSRAQQLQKLDENESRNRQGDMEDPGLSNVEPISKDYELTSPLMSDNMIKVDVIEKKSEKSLMGAWKTTLVVVTADSFLHFFEIPAYANIRPGAAAEVAFQALVPDVEVPTEDTMKAGKLAFGKPWYEFLIPSDSISLKNSVISFKEKTGDTVFDITETVVASGAAKIFSKKPAKRKFSIRVFSKHEMVDWVLVLGKKTN